jgi:hypothetical protein
MIRYRQFVAVGAVLLSAVGLTGCFKASGGGVLIGGPGSQHPGAIISVGFAMRCDDVGGVGIITGQFQFNDHTDRVVFHGVINSPVNGGIGNYTCEEGDALVNTPPFTPLQSTLVAFGTYTPQPPTLSDGGTIEVAIQDGSSVFVGGCGDGGDGLAIQVSGGVYDGYPANVCLNQGNFTVFTE